MQSTEAEGRTIDEAIARALALLGVARDRVDIEILAAAARGLFGFGGRPARVRATLRRPADTGSEPAAETPREPAPPPRRNGGGARPVAAQTPPSSTVPERARAVLAEIVRLCGVVATVRIAGARLLIEGDPTGALIGRRGTTLDALEYVVNRVAGHDGDRAGPVEVDANDYRARRRAALEALARRIADRARAEGRPVAMDPLSPRERRIVHLALQGDPTLTTRSVGAGVHRRLLIIPASSRART